MTEDLADVRKIAFLKYLSDDQLQLTLDASGLNEDEYRSYNFTLTLSEETVAVIYPKPIEFTINVFSGIEEITNSTNSTDSDGLDDM